MFHAVDLAWSKKAARYADRSVVRVCSSANVTKDPILFTTVWEERSSSNGPRRLTKAVRWFEKACLCHRPFRRSALQRFGRKILGNERLGSGAQRRLGRLFSGFSSVISVQTDQIARTSSWDTYTSVGRREPHDHPVSFNERTGIQHDAVK